MRLERTYVSFQAVGVILAALIGCLVAVAPSAAQQAGTVAGTVTDASTGEPLAAVQVSVVGTPRGTLTDRQGRFSIPGVPAGDREIRAQSLGFSTLTTTVQVVGGETLTLNLELRRTVIDMEEIVVTGVSGETARAKLPFTVDRLTAASLPVPSPNAGSLLQAKVAGATVVQGSGRPGAPPSILLRGPTSINAQGRDQEPLYIVDGVILGSSLVDLDALDIENIEVVKGAAAASLYGSRAGNGVIQITTRRGRDVGDDQVRYTVRTEYGRSSLENEFDLTRRHQFQMTEDGSAFIDAETGQPCQFFLCSSVNLAGQRAGPDENPNEWNTFQNLDYPQTFDNIGAVFDPGNFLQNHISVEGRSGGTNYLMSFSNMQEDGVIVGQNGFTRNNFRVNVDQSVRPDLTVSASAFLSRSRQDQFPEFQGNPLFNLTRMPAGVDITRRFSRDAQGNLVEDPDGDLLIAPDPFNENDNPLEELLNRQFKQSRNRVLSSASVRYEPTRWADVTANASFDRLDSEFSDFFERGFRTARAEAINQGGLFTGETRTEAFNSSVTGTVRHRLGDDLAVRLQGRWLYEEQSFDNRNAGGTDLAARGVPTLDNLQDPDRISVGSSRTAIRAEGWFLSANLDFRDRYIVDALFRRDGSSLFGSEERWQNYFRVAGAYRLSEEEWFNVDHLNELKFRYSYGTAGGRPNFQAQFETFAVTGGVITPLTLGNRALKPELVVEQEAGVDLVAFERLSLNLTYALTNAEDQILPVPLPATTGFSTQWQNVGTLRSNTIEATLGAELLRHRDVSWSANVTFDRTRQRISELNPDVPPFTYGVAGQQMGDIFFAREGEALGTFYGFRHATRCQDLPGEIQGLCDSHFDVNNDGLLVFVGEGGTWRDGNWGTTGELNGRTFDWGAPVVATGIDRVTGEETDFLPVGNTTPDFTLSWSSTLSWRGFHVYGLFDWVQGFDVWNQPLQWATFQSYSGIMDQAGLPEDEQKPVGYYSRLYNRLSPSNVWVEDGSFIKLRELSVSYRLGADRLAAIGLPDRLAGIGFSVTGRNLITWTDYNGYDPETGRGGGATGSAVLARVDGFNYPNFRTWTFAVNVNF